MEEIHEKYEKYEKVNELLGKVVASVLEEIAPIIERFAVHCGETHYKLLKDLEDENTRLLDENSKVKTILKMAHGVSDFEKTWKLKEENDKLQALICEKSTLVGRCEKDRANLLDENRKMKAIISAKAPGWNSVADRWKRLL